MTFNPTYREQITQDVQTGAGGLTFQFLIARVTHVVQGPLMAKTNIPDPYYSNPNDLGVITFQLLTGQQDRTKDSAGNNLAKPFYFSIKQIPLEGEFVLIFPGPGLGMNESRGARDFFYLLPYNLWNASHQNAFPDPGDYGAFVNNQNKNYENSNQNKQSTNLSVTGSPMPLTPNFIEKANIRSLRQFTGDVTIEGRWGNSIRFGSTTLARDENTWSVTGSVGNPIIIIRNGQGRQENNVPWIPTVEDINRDASSIYLTEGQQIVINDITRNFSLKSLGKKFETATSLAIPVQQQFTSNDTISPAEQDNQVASVAPPVEEPPAPTAATTTTTTTASPTPPSPPPPQNPKGNYLKDYTNRAGNVLELYSTKKGFNTTIYAYKKDTGALVKTGMPSSTAPLDVLIKEMELSLVDNVF